MKLNRQSIRAAVLVMMLVLAACEGDRPQLEIKLKPGYSQIISEIKGVNAALAEKLAAIEKTLSGGFSDNAAALAAIKSAVSSLEGTAAEKLAAIEAAVKAQTASLEAKLALVEAAVESGFADTAAAQGLIKDAIDALQGSTEEKLAAIESAVKAQTASLEAKLALVEAAVESGFADTAAAQGLIKDAIDALKGSTEEKLAAIDAAVKAQTASLEAKLALVDKAVKDGFTTSAGAQDLIKKAIEALKGSAEEKLAAIDTAVKAQTASLEAKLALVDKAVKDGFANSAKAQDLINKAIEALKGSAEDKLAAIAKAVTDQTTSFETKLNTIEGAVTSGFATSAGAQDLIKKAIESLDKSMGDKLANVLKAIGDLPDHGKTLEDIKNAIDTLRKMFVLSVSLDKAAMTMYKSGKAALTATIFPDDATNKSVTWKSSDATVAEVSQEGTVTAKRVGNATITVTTVVGGNTATCEVTVKEPEYVDLGFKVSGKSIKWATVNVGANAPEEYGDYFAWGEVEPNKKEGYHWTNLRFRESGYSVDDVKFSKYCTKSYAWAGSGNPDNKVQLDYQDDAARANWGGSWRMPTQGEFEALRDSCNVSLATQNGVYGYRFTSKSNGKSIFLPAAGRWLGGGLSGPGQVGEYLFSTLGTIWDNPRYLSIMYFSSGDIIFARYVRYYGRSVRPVRE